MPSTRSSLSSLYALAGDLDADYVLTWQQRILDVGDARLEHFTKLLRAP